MIEPYRGTREAILEALQSGGPKAAATVARQLGISLMAVRDHLKKLEAQGFIECRVERGRVGRPAHLFAPVRSTGPAESPLSENLLRDVLEVIGERLGDKGLREILDEATDARIARHRVELGQLSGGQRLQALARLLEQRGFKVDTREDDDAIEFRIEECPLAPLADQFPETCEQERRWLAELSGQEVELIDCQGRNNPTCRFVVRNREREQ